MDSDKTIATGEVTNSRKYMTGIFADHLQAENAYNALLERGYTKEEINLIMSDETRKKYFSNVVVKESGIIAAQDAAIGSSIGGTVGAIIGAIAAIGTSIAIPGLGLIIAGPIAAGLAGAGAGIVSGGVIGALAGAGVPENHAKIYESGIKEGQILIGFHPHTEDDAVYFENNWIENKKSDLVIVT